MATNWNKLKIGGPAGKTGGDMPFLRYRGVFDFDGLYKLIKSWSSYKQLSFYETLYKHKPPEVELKWLMERKTNGYNKNSLTVGLHIWGLHRIEAVVDGKKKTMYEGRMEIQFDGWIDQDFDDSWNAGDSYFRTMVKKFYDKYVISNEQMLTDVDLIIEDLRELSNNIKEFLGMEGV